ncbi:MAG TPA: response regulator transcription factor [Candidatus Sulfotelmatobacter sp.]|jgi:two-component system alkaline phosphatase synthesis response regulator PhoP
MNENILLVEDEEALRMTLSDRLRSVGYVVDFAADGDEGLNKATGLPFDLIILDVMLPNRSGFDVCRDIRKAGLATPILLLTARDQTVDKVLGLKLGADDYVTKPFDTLELMARLEALLRRAPGRASQSVYQVGPIRMDVRGTEVTRNGQPVYLSAREFQLLRHFMEHPGATLSRDELLQEVWGYEDGTFTRTVDVHIASLRQKLEQDPKRPELILTVPRTGYKLKA